MAVEDKYINDTDVGSLDPIDNAGAIQKIANVSFEIAAADTSGSKYRLFRSINSMIKLVKLIVSNDAITGATDIDIGLYETESGAVISADLFSDGLDFSSAGREENGMTNVVIDDVGKRIFEIAGQAIADRDIAVDIVITANTLGAGAGTVYARIETATT